jgi:hypothetical protein
MYEDPDNNMGVCIKLRTMYGRQTISKGCDDA